MTGASGKGKGVAEERGWLGTPVSVPTPTSDRHQDSGPGGPSAVLGVAHVGPAVCGCGCLPPQDAPPSVPRCAICGVQTPKNGGWRSAGHNPAQPDVLAPRDPARWDQGGTRIAFSPRFSIPCPGTSDELPVGHPGDAGLGGAHCGTHQLQPLAPAQRDVCGQLGEGGQGEDGEGEPANGPASRVHRRAGVASSIPFLYEDERSSVILIWAPAAALAH